MSRARHDLFAFLAGIVFGLGLAISQMINPQKVLAFLDVAGDWDPSLALVMGGALAVTFTAYRLVLRRPSPLFATRFHLPTRTDIDARLLAGAAIFGIGWGAAGYCPGPAIAGIALAGYGFLEPFVFIAALLVGTLAAKALVR